MKYKFLNDNEIYTENNSKLLKFLYNTFFGRIVLKPITSRFFSKIIRIVMDSKMSVVWIKSYIKKHNIEMEKYEEKKFKSFNDFFIRKEKSIKSDSKENEFISTANSKISCYTISDELIINVKNSKYSITELIKDEELANQYKDGVCIIYRLSPSNCHRYIFCDSGELNPLQKIKGKLHTVNPIVYDKYQVFTENYREVSELNTKKFGKIIQIEVGALGIGKIINKDISDFSKYEEKGYFEFGGSTIIQLIKRDMIKINSEIENNTKEDIETFVEVGEVIGVKI